MTESDEERTVLAIDIGGSHVKVLTGGRGRDEIRRATSGPGMGPAQMVAAVQELTGDWRFDVVSIGYPGPVGPRTSEPRDPRSQGAPAAEPRNLAQGWVGFDFEAAFGRPVRLVNDAAMQALGSYEGGKMLFLGLGTGLGSALVVDGVLVPLELAHLPYRKGKSYEDAVGERALERRGKRKWRSSVARIAHLFQQALLVDYVVLGGGNVRHLKELPAGCRRGDNANAFEGGFRLWRPRA